MLTHVAPGVRGRPHGAGARGPPAVGGADGADQVTGLTVSGLDLTEATWLLDDAGFVQAQAGCITKSTEVNNEYFDRSVCMPGSIDVSKTKNTRNVEIVPQTELFFFLRCIKHQNARTARAPAPHAPTHPRPRDALTRRTHARRL